MKSKLMTALSAPALFALLSVGTLTMGTLASASTVTQNVSIDSGAASTGNPLYVGNGDQTITLPLSALGGSIPADLTVSSSDLPVNVTVTLTGAKQDGDNVVLSVSTQSVNGDTVTGAVDAQANLSLISGGKTLTVFQVPVESPVNGATPRLNAATDN